MHTCITEKTPNAQSGPITLLLYESAQFSKGRTSLEFLIDFNVSKKLLTKVSKNYKNWQNFNIILAPIVSLQSGVSSTDLIRNRV